MPYQINATGSQTIGAGEEGVEVDPGTEVLGCGLTFYTVGAPTLSEIPAGNYLGASAGLVWDGASGGNSRDARLIVYDSGFSTVDEDFVSGTGLTLSMSIGAFTVPSGGGYVGLGAASNAATPTTVDETSYFSVTCAGGGRKWWLGVAGWTANGGAT